MWFIHPGRQTLARAISPSLARYPARSPLITPLGHFDTALLSLLTAAKNKIFGSDPESCSQHGRTTDQKQIGMQRFLMEIELADFKVVEAVQLLCL